MPTRRSESVELVTLTLERIDELESVQRNIRKRIKNQLTDNELSVAIGGLASILGMFLIAGNPIAGALTTIVGGTAAIASLSTGEKTAVLQSIENGFDGLYEAKMKIKNDPSRNYVRAYVGFLNYDNLGMRTVSSEYLDYI